jgi:type I restriction enzyme S subunit
MSWPTLPFPEVFIDATGGNIKTKQSEYLPTGAYPIVDQGKALVGGYTDEEASLCKSDEPVIVFGDHTKALKYVDFPFCLGADGTKVLVPKIDADLRFLYYALHNVDIPDAGYSRHFKFLKRGEIPLPPFEEQRRIAGILDAADALRRRRGEALALLDTLPGAIFAEMFGSLTTSERYPRGPLSEVIDGFSTGKNLAPASDEEGTRHRVLKVSAVTKGEFLEVESKPLPAEYSPPESHFVRPGDLLFSRANTSALIGATALVETVSENVVLPDKIWRFDLDDRKANPTFLHHLFATRKFRDEVSRRASGSSGSMKNISKGKVLSIEIAKPSIEEQNEFARRVKIGRSIRTQNTAHLIELETLFASLQSRAFAGAL